MFAKVLDFISSQNGLALPVSVPPCIEGSVGPTVTLCALTKQEILTFRATERQWSTVQSGGLLPELPRVASCCRNIETVLSAIKHIFGQIYYYYYYYT
jgi:hypothetical protein